MFRLKQKLTFDWDNPHQLDNPIYTFDSGKILTWRQLHQGIFITGQIGSGKSSSFSRAVFKSGMRYGAGSVCSTAVQTDLDQYLTWMKEDGIKDENIFIISPQSGLRFNAFAYEYFRPGGGAGNINETVKLFMLLLEVESKSGGKGGGDKFWDSATEEFISMLLTLLTLALERLNLSDINDLMMSIPKDREQMDKIIAALEDPEGVDEQYLQRHGFFLECIMLGDDKRDSGQLGGKEYDYQRARQYITEKWPNLADKTRSIIEISVSSLLNKFLSSPIREIFCSDKPSNVLPEFAFHGGQIILDLPISEYGAQGRFAQILFVTLFQRAAKRRKINKDSRSVMLFQDECQNFITSESAKFQTVARHSKICTTMITQNLPNLYAELGGDEKAKHFVHSLVGNLGLKVGHCNSCTVTNKWYSDVIGKGIVYRTTINTGESDNDGQSHTDNKTSINSSSGTTFGTACAEQKDVKIEPNEFTKLKQGGKPNNLVVEAIMIRNTGDSSQSGEIHSRETFRQDWN